MDLIETAYIGIGSNLDHPATQVRRAVEALRGLPQSRLLSCSSLYRSPPMGPQDQPDFVNAVVSLQTGLGPHDLLKALHEIEDRQGRVRTRHWGERTLDLDLLLYGQCQIFDETLRVPHPGIAQRAFVLVPLQEIAPALEVPGMGAVSELVKACPEQGLKRDG